MPSEDIVRGFVGKCSMMDSHAIYSLMSRVPEIRQYIPMIRDFVSDMERSELANVLISYLDIHYHDLLVEIENDDKKYKLFRGTMSLLLDDLVGVAQ